MLIFFFAGERADVVLHTDNKISTYEINVYEKKGCNPTPITGKALLKYDKTSNELIKKIIDNKLSINTEKNYPDMTTNPVDKCGIAGNICGNDIKSVEKISSSLQNFNVDEKIYLSINQVMQSSEILGLYKSHYFYHLFHFKLQKKKKYS